jgi:hypothetical protein
MHKAAHIRDQEDAVRYAESRLEAERENQAALLRVSGRARDIAGERIIRNLESILRREQRHLKQLLLLDECRFTRYSVGRP